MIAGGGRIGRAQQRRPKRSSKVPTTKNPPGCTISAGCGERRAEHDTRRRGRRDRTVAEAAPAASRSTTPTARTRQASMKTRRARRGMPLRPTAGMTPIDHPDRSPLTAPPPPPPPPHPPAGSGEGTIDMPWWITIKAPPRPRLGVHSALTGRLRGTHPIRIEGESMLHPGRSRST